MTETELLECGETERRRLESHPVRIGCCMSSGCLSSGSAAVLEALKAAAPSADVFPVGCMGPCSRGPLAWVKQGERTRTYQQLTPELAPSAVQGVIDHRHVVPADDPFFAQQLRIVTSNCGVINPERLEDAVAAGAYQALAQVLREWDPARVCDEITRSGLRGRGGAGYPTGVKWNLVRKAPGGQKYVIANGDEGGPGAYMDRAIMESDPHRVLEGMAIAGYAVGASHGYIYVRGEYPTAVHRLDMAVKQATRRGILGKNVLGTKFEFHVEVRIGAGAFVCGEETALIASIEGGRGMPRPRPPYPAEVGLFGKPTLINNVETLAAIAPICLNGADWFASIGTATSKGTKVFALSGAVVNTGLIEVPMGTTLREIVFHIGGGIPGGKRFKAVQTGGPSGGCIPEQYL
ncbi:MAG: SLBB domain-containing protein, partial [Gemmataceae bacterium]|nr:SLBB domain-containing protein [Gemmataceae bacterium]